MRIFKNPFFYATVLLSAVLVFQIVGFVNAAWTEPPQAFPAGNPAAPLDTSGTSQTKGATTLSNTSITLGSSAMIFGTNGSTPQASYIPRTSSGESVMIFDGNRFSIRKFGSGVDLLSVASNGNINVSESSAGYGRIYFNSNSGVAGVINRGTGTSDLYFGESQDSGRYIFRGSGALTTEGGVGIGGSVGVGGTVSIGPGADAIAQGTKLQVCTYNTSGGCGAGNVIRVGNDVDIADVDAANTIGFFGTIDPPRASLRLGTNGGTISGAGGGIGIGTTLPSAAFHVVGSVRVDVPTNNSTNPPFQTHMPITVNGITYYIKLYQAPNTYLVNGIHTTQQCRDIGGQPITYGVSDYPGGPIVMTAQICPLTGSSCPGGWSRFRDFTRTTPRSCSGNDTSQCPMAGGQGATNCTTLSHAFSNTPAESCGFYNEVYTGPGLSGSKSDSSLTASLSSQLARIEPPSPVCNSSFEVCTANVVEVGCY